MKLSIVILTFRNPEMALRCLQSIHAFPPREEFEVLLIENESRPENIALFKKNFPKIKTFPQKTNLKYAPANNIGIRASQGEYTLLLNDDIIFNGDAIQKMIDFLDSHKNVGAVAPLLQYPNKKIQPTVRSFPTLKNLLFQFLVDFKLLPNRPPFSNYKLSHWNHLETRSVDQPMASCFLIRTALLKKLKGFDERFIHYFNDVDLCFRIKKEEHLEIYHLVVDPPVTHHHGVGSKYLNLERIRLWNQGIKRFFLKHHTQNRKFSLKYIFLNLFLAPRTIIQFMLYWLHKNSR
jgi:GT2 family glycosyltransferase